MYSVHVLCCVCGIVNMLVLSWIWYSVVCSGIVYMLHVKCIIVSLVWCSIYYASVGGAPEAYGSRPVCVCVCVCMSLPPVSLQWLKGKR